MIRLASVSSAGRILYIALGELFYSSSGLSTSLDLKVP